MQVVSEEEFYSALVEKLKGVEVKAVMGPGRSGSIASAYASHLLGVPFIPYGHRCPDHLKPLLVVDTATLTGRTLRKAANRYGDDCVVISVFEQPPRVKFWYEAGCRELEKI